MSRSSTKLLGLVLVLAISALLLAPNHTLLRAQPPAEATQDEAAATPKKQKKPRGRLPLFFSKIVSGDQREEIYDIQAKYAPEMDALVEQMVALRNQMQEEIKSILTSKQIKRLAELRKEAKQRRAERAAERAAAESGDSE